MSAFSATHRLGNGPHGNKDVHMYEIVVHPGDIGSTYTFGTSQPQKGTAVNTFIRLFDAKGTPVRHANDTLVHDISSGKGNYSYMEWKPTIAGNYYLGVSSFGGVINYNPHVAGSGGDGTTGHYTLVINYRPLPANFRCTGHSPNSITLEWDRQNSETNYVLWYRKVLSVSLGESQEVKLNATPVRITGLVANTVYEFTLLIKHFDVLSRVSTIHAKTAAPLGN
jgi:hypothetical protein